MIARARILIALAMVATTPILAQAPSRQVAARAAIHPVASPHELQAWLARVPQTRDWPPDLAETLRGQASSIVVEMSTAPGCLACAHLWAELNRLAPRYGLRIVTLSESSALLRSGRLGLPWIGHPVAWVRAAADENRLLPIAIGTDHAANLARNIYLATKMLAGVRPAVGVRAMAKFTGIVAPADRRPPLGQRGSRNGLTRSGQ